MSLKPSLRGQTLKIGKVFHWSSELENITFLFPVFGIQAMGK